MLGRNDDGDACGHKIGDRYLLIQVSRALVNTLMLQDVLTEEKWKASMKLKTGAD
jgi:TnpA family transposase